MSKQEPVAQVKAKPPPASGGWGAGYSRVVVYGQAKMGKTSFAGTMPGKLMWVQCSGGSISGELESIDTPENRERITPKNVTSVAQLQDIINEIRQDGYDGAVLDHVTGLATRLLQEVLGLEEIPRNKKWGEINFIHYGEAAVKVEKFLYEFYSLPCATTVIAQQRLVGEEEEKKSADEDIIGFKITPDVGKSTRRWLFPAASHILQVFRQPKFEEVEKVNPVTKKAYKERVKVAGYDYCLRTGPHDRILTGFRLPRGGYLPPYITDPTWEKFQKIAKGQWQEGDE